MVDKAVHGARRSDPTPLFRERRFLEAHRRRLSAKYKGMFLLIKGTDLVGAYPDARSAYRDGSSRFGWDPFLVQQV
jgi:hypothetical protein